MMSANNSRTRAPTAQEIRSCFNMGQLLAWQEDVKCKGVTQCISKRVDVLMTMNIRKAKEEDLTDEQKRELELFEEQYRNRKQLPYHKAKKQGCFDTIS